MNMINNIAVVIGQYAILTRPDSTDDAVVRSEFPQLVDSLVEYGSTDHQLNFVPPSEYYAPAENAEGDHENCVRPCSSCLKSDECSDGNFDALLFCGVENFLL